MTKELIHSNDNQHSLVLWEGEYEPLVLWHQSLYVVCSYYDATAREGAQWCWGHYFRNYDDALEYFVGKGYLNTNYTKCLTKEA